MGELAARTIFANDTGPLAGVGLDTLAKNQAAILELEGAQAPQSKTIASGSISPTAAYVIVDTEGSAAADDLSVISPVLSASENLHVGMVIYLKAADSGRVVTVKNSSSANGINTYDGNDYVLSTTHWLKLQLRAGKWYEIEGRAMETALAAATAAANAATAADHAQTKSGTSSTASGTAAKVVTCSGFELSTNARIFVTFSNANTVADAITLNVNGTGAKAVYNQTGIISASNTALFAANQPIEFRYDGVGWVFHDVAKGLATSMLCNKRMVVTTSGAITAPVTGWAKVKLIAGGGAGGDSNYDLGGKGGGKGGDTSLAGKTATGGSGGGAGAYWSGSAGGGGAGEIVEFYVYMTKGVPIGTAVIGAGGVYSASPNANGVGTKGGIGATFAGNASWGSFGQGGGNGGQNGSPVSASNFTGYGGNGGSNGTPYGGGGGGAKGYYQGGPTYSGGAGIGGANGSNGNLASSSGNVAGGAGGQGAIYIDYFDPDFTG